MTSFPVVCRGVLLFDLENSSEITLQPRHMGCGGNIFSVSIVWNNSQETIFEWEDIIITSANKFVRDFLK